MTNIDVIRAWKDEDYLSGLNDAERAMLPENPAGIFELTEADLTDASGAAADSAATITVCITMPVFFTMWALCPI